ncbi:NAD(P)-binding protein [Xylariaceae sp. AK1471]|nr:NAD(P)-binding protein [Xylariaceae sp. AK1471]
MASEKKFALVTGCGCGGIGEALVAEFTRQDIHSIATVLPTEASDHLTDKGLTFFTLDVTVDKSVRDLAEAVKELTGGHLDFLVNCAGIAYTMTAIDTDVAAVQRMFDVNLFGPMRMVHAFHSMIIEAKGSIINIGSIGGVIPFMYGSSYNASKAALHHWGNTLRVEMAPFGTNILKSDAHRTLPAGSYYTPLAENFRQHVTRIPPGTTDRFKYAENVVRQSLRSSPPAWFWYGSFTTLTRLLDTFGWRTVWDGVMWNMFGLAKLRRAHQDSAKKLA